ncbi:hypothetical protein ACIBLB_45400, partial [Streptosporangium canum]|uniref:hypothetical protein n=1 Tax=Streptosporangium canum TaxID=324952 RepID=UPI0037AA5B2E
EIDQPAPLAHDRGQAGIRPAASWPGLGGHGVLVIVSLTPLVGICPHQFDKTAQRTVRLARRLTCRGVALPDW